MLQRLYGGILSLALIGLSLWPLFRSPPQDSYPFSNYPMFARKKGHPLVHRVVGITASGERVRIPPEMIANDEVMQAYRTIRLAVIKGRKRTAQLCRVTADTIRRTKAMPEVRRLEVLTDRYDSIRYFSGDTKPMKTRTHSRCRVTQ